MFVPTHFLLNFTENLYCFFSTFFNHRMSSCCWKTIKSNHKVVELILPGRSLLKCIATSMGMEKFGFQLMPLPFCGYIFFQKFHSYAKRILPQSSKPGGDAYADTLLQPLVRTQIVFNSCSAVQPLN